MNNNMFSLYMWIYCYDHDLVIINSSYSTETECSDFLFAYVNGVADQGREGSRGVCWGGGGRGVCDVAKLWVWNDFQFLKPTLHLSYSNPIR